MRADVQKIFKKTPANKQVMMFTATLPDDIKEVCKKFMRKPVEIIVNEENKDHLDKLRQFYVNLTEEEKNKKLFDILDLIQFNQVIIFVNSIQRCVALKEKLNNNNFPAIAIHADLPQEERIKQFDLFKAFKKRIMVATELYGRGVDFVKVNTVINYDMANCIDAYIHRVGRAGRFGTKGITVTFITTENDKKIFDEFLKKYPNKAEVLPDKIDPSMYSKYLFLIINNIFRLNLKNLKDDRIEKYIFIFIILKNLFLLKLKLSLSSNIQTFYIIYYFSFFIIILVIIGYNSCIF